MPPVIGAAAAAVGAAIAGAGIAKIVGVFAINLVLGLATSLLSGKKAKAPAQDFTSFGSERSQVIRSSVATHKIVHGTVMVSGPLVFAAATGASKEYLHLVIPLAGHQVEEIGTVFLDDLPSTNARFSGLVDIYRHTGTTDQAADANLTASVPEWTSAHRLRGIAYIYVRLKFNATAFPNGIPNIKAIVKGRRVWDPRAATVDILTSSVASESVITTDGAHGLGGGDRVFITGHTGSTPALSGEYQVLSAPTTTTITIDQAVTVAGSGGALSEMAWSDNAALCQLDYLVAPFGLGAAESEVDTATWIAAANVCDESVSLPVVVASLTFQGVVNVTAGADSLTKSGGVTNVWDAGASTVERITGGDGSIQVTVNASIGASSFGLALSDAATDPTDQTFGLFLAADGPVRTVQNGVQQSAVGTWSAGDTFKIAIESGEVRYYQNGTLLTTATSAPSYPLRADFSLNFTNAAFTGIAFEYLDESTAQARYDANGVVDLGNKPADIMEDLLSASAGVMVYASGTYRGHAGASATAAVTITADDLRGPIPAVEPRMDRRDLYNAVRGTFVDPADQWQPTDFPPVTSATYAEQDGGEEIFRDIELPYTTNRFRAQRLAKIVLEQSRQAVRVMLPCKPTAIDVATWDVVAVTIDYLGWSAKNFRVTGWTLNPDGGVDLYLQEHAASIYTWDPETDATIPDPAPNTSLPDPFQVEDPTDLEAAEEIYVTRDGAGVKARVNLTWTAAADAFVVGYEPQFKLQASSTWTVLPRTSGVAAEINDIAPGRYDFRVRAFNGLGAVSDFAERSLEVAGLAGTPADITGLTLAQIGGWAILQWTPAADIDVKVGGTIRVRHSHQTVAASATWEDARDIGPALPGAGVQALLPLVAGTYLVKAVDSSGIPSANAAKAATTAAEALTFANVSSLNEASGGFNGTHSDTVDDAGVLMLAGSGDVDAIADVDAVADWDTEGGIATSGTYTFQAGIDMGAVGTPKRVRASAAVTAAMSNVRDLIDGRAALVDSWDDFDGTGSASATVSIFSRDTDDDPAGTPTWRDWRPLPCDFRARAFQFKAELATNDPAFNIGVSALTVSIDEVA